MGRPSIQEQPMTVAERQRRHRQKLQRENDAAVDLFTMTNLYPRRTGLPMTVWVSPRGRARHAARIKVNMQHGERMTIGNTAVVRLRPVPTVIAGKLSASDQILIFTWIAMNEAALIDHWNSVIDGGDLIERLRPVPAETHEAVRRY